jgi:hypothetical protein
MAKKAAKSLAVKDISAKIIQKFVNEQKCKLSHSQKLQPLRTLSKIIYHVLFGHIFNHVLGKIKRESTRRLFIKIFLILRNKCSYNLKYTFRKVNYFSNRHKRTNLHFHAQMIQNAYRRYKQKLLVRYKIMRIANSRIQNKAFLTLLFSKYFVRQITDIIRAISLFKY